MYKAFNGGALGIGLPFEDSVQLAKKNGFQGIYFDPRWAAGVGVDQAKKVFDGLKPACFGLPIDYMGDSIEFTGKIEELRELGAVAKALGCTRCSTWVKSWSDALDYDENFQFQRRRLQWVGNALKDNGISLGLEFLGPKTLRTEHKYEFIHTMDEMLRLGLETGTGNIGLLLDCWHWYTSGGTLEEIGKLHPKKVVDVHINDAPAGIPVDEQIDSVRALPGETGVIDVKGFLRQLRAIGYDGPVMAEPFSQRLREMEPEQAAAETAKAIDSVWPE